MTEPRLLVVADDAPFPPNHGGRVDVWSRHRLLRRLGCRASLIAWSSGETPSAADMAAMEAVFDEVRVFPIRRSLGSMAWRAAMLPFHSPHAATRILRGGAYAEALATARRLNPDAVFIDNLFGGVTGRRLARDLGLPFFYRAHNVEHQYKAGQAAAATSLRDRLAWFLASLHLERFEEGLQRDALRVFDISWADLAYWRARGVTRNLWVPTFVEPPAVPAPPWAARPFDVVYLGNLHAPNNVRGLAWLIEAVLPRVRRTAPDLRVCIAGARPSDPMRRIISGHPEISFVIDAPDAAAVWASGRVLVNPVLSGSGLNVKSVEMLFHDARLVSTPVGVQGLAPELRAEFEVAAEPEAFADAILGALGSPFAPTPSRDEARRRLGPDGAADLLAAMRDALATP